MSLDHDERRASDRELARILRLIDGDDKRDGIELRLDRVERLALAQGNELTELRSLVKVLIAHADGHPLLDKDVARSVVEHIGTAHARGAAARAFGLVVGRSALDTLLRIVEISLLAYLAVHIGIR